MKNDPNHPDYIISLLVFVQKEDAKDQRKMNRFKSVEKKRDKVASAFKRKREDDTELPSISGSTENTQWIFYHNELSSSPGGGLRIATSSKSYQRNERNAKVYRRNQ